jgi:hypothetical protein
MRTEMSVQYDDVEDVLAILSPMRCTTAEIGKYCYTMDDSTSIWLV